MQLRCNTHMHEASTQARCSRTNVPLRAGIFARADTKNNNKRVYPKVSACPCRLVLHLSCRPAHSHEPTTCMLLPNLQALLCREAAKFEQERIVSGTALGELDHPNYASRYFKCLNLANVSHQVSTHAACFAHLV